MPNSGQVGGNMQNPTGTDIFGHTVTQGMDSTEAALKSVLSGVAPQLAQSQLQTQLGQDALGLVGPQTQAQLAYNQTMSGYQAQNLGLSEQQLGLQQLGNTQQQAQAATQQGLEEKQYQLQAGQFPEQQAEVQLAYQNALRNTQGAQAISGTQNTVGGRADIATLQAQQGPGGFAQQDIARAQALSQLGQQGEESGYQYSQQQLQNAAKSLSLNAQANGISEQQLMTMLNYGQTQTATSGAQNIISLLSQIGQGALSSVGGAGQALSALGAKSGFNALAGNQ